MTLGYRLVPLSCPSCGAPLQAEPDDVIYYCTGCRNGYLLDRASGQLGPLPVTFLAAAGKVVTRHLPFWWLPARVQLLERSTEGGGGLMSLFGKSPQGAGDALDVNFAIPAYLAPLSRLVPLAQRYTGSFPNAGELLAERLTGGAMRVEDAQTWAHFALISAEAAKPDLLTQLRYTITFGEARLLGVPFVGEAAALRDAFFGLPAT